MKKYLILVLKLYVLGIKIYRICAKPGNTNIARSSIHDKGTFHPIPTNPPIEPKLLCPKGFDLIGSNCVLTDTVPPNIVCPEEYELDKINGVLQCILRDIIKPEFTCESNIIPVLKDGKMICPSDYFLEPNKICPPGYIEKDDYCFRRSYKPPELTCPDSYSIDSSNKCKRVIESNPLLNCPPDTYLDSKTMACVIKILIEPLLVCPPGAIPVKSRDLIDMKSLLNKLTSDAHKNYYQDNRKLQVIPTVGEEMSQGRGSKSINSVTATSTTNPYYSTSNTPPPPYPSNSQNPSNQNQNNFVYSTTTTTTKTPNLLNNNNIPTISNINNGNTNISQPFNNNINSISSQNNHTYYTGTVGDYNEDKFYNSLYNSTKDLRNKGILNESRIGDEIVCLILEFVDPHIECPPDLEFNSNGTCSFYHQFTPPRSCEGGIEPNSDNLCLIEKLLPTEVECPKNYTLDILSGMCVIKETKNLICPEGTKLNKKTHKCEVDPKCPEGYTYNPKTFLCEKENQVPPHPKCPEGTEYNEKTNSCKATDAQLPLLLCPEGYEQVGEACVKKKEVPASFYCPQNYYQTNTNICVKWRENYLLQCPPFLELQSYSYATTIDLLPPPGAGRGPVMPMTEFANTRMLQSVEKTYTQSTISQRKTVIPYNTNNLGSSHVMTAHMSNKTKQSFSQLQAGNPVLIKSEKTHNMVCFGWGKRYKMIVNCPENTVLMNGKCTSMQLLSPTQTCIKGYIWNDYERSCVYDEQAKPNLSCPKDTILKTLSNNRILCVGYKYQLSQVDCPEGYRFNQQTNECEMEETQNPIINCVKGYSMESTHNGKICRRVEEIPATYSCPQEYKLDEIKKICTFDLKLNQILQNKEHYNIR